MEDRSRQDVLAQVARSELVAAEAVAASRILDCGVALYNEAWPRLPEINQVREVALEGKVSIPPQQAWDEVTAFYAERKLTPLRWSASVRLTGRGLGEFLAGHGYERRTQVAMVRPSGVLTPDWQPVEMQVLPARAAPRGYAELSAERFADDPHGDARAAVARARVNDTRLTMLVARIDEQAAACCGVLSLGDVGRVRGLYVARAFADRADPIALTLIGKIIELGYRYQFATFCCLLEESDAVGQSLYRRCGFEPVGELVYHEKT
ncbi:MAG: hypothetical protein BIFFINMI_00972 [Phycisphaerae bacterium]|nr:hypothetical protein [Phycisphaerae bacterium]